MPISAMLMVPGQACESVFLSLWKSCLTMYCASMQWRAEPAAALPAATGNDYQKDRQFRKINSAKDTIDVAVVRGGTQLVVSNVDVVVGDVMLLDTGDKARLLLRPVSMQKYCLPKPAKCHPWVVLQSPAGAWRRFHALRLASGMHPAIEGEPLLQHPEHQCLPCCSRMC